MLLPEDDVMMIDIHAAVQANDEERIKKYVTQGGNLEAKDKDKCTPLHIAAAGGLIDVVQYLMQEGACVDSVSKIGHTPLHLACRFGHQPVVLLLLAMGARLNARDTDDNTPLHKAASNGKAKLCRELVKKGADIDARNDTSYTPLHWACFKGHKGAAEQLLKCGANINATSCRRATALFMSAFYGHVEVTHLLLTWGADSSIVNEDDIRPGETFYAEVPPVQQAQTRRLLADRHELLMKGYEAARRISALMFMRSERSEDHLRHSQDEVDLLWEKLRKREKELNRSTVGARDLSSVVKTMKVALEKSLLDIKTLREKVASLETVGETARKDLRSSRKEAEMHRQRAVAAETELRELRNATRKNTSDQHQPCIVDKTVDSREQEHRKAYGADMEQGKGQASGETSPSSMANPVVANIPADANMSGPRTVTSAHVHRSSSFSSSEGGQSEDQRESPSNTGAFKAAAEPLPPSPASDVSCVTINSGIVSGTRSISPPCVPPLPSGRVAAHASKINTRVMELGKTAIVPSPAATLSRSGSYVSLLGLSPSCNSAPGSPAMPFSESKLFSGRRRGDEHILGRPLPAGVMRSKGERAKSLGGDAAPRMGAFPLRKRMPLMRSNSNDTVPVSPETPQGHACTDGDVIGQAMTVASALLKTEVMASSSVKRVR